MLLSDIPVKFNIPWANSAVPGTGVRAIPTASQIGTQPGAASLTDGFPPLNFIPVGAGGIPPFGQDMNGILKQITSWIRWNSAGGPIKFDSAYAGFVGGYPANAVVLSTSGHAWYENLVNGNAVDPNAGGANWRIISCVWSSGVWTAAGSANAQLITFTPPAASFTQLAGIPFTFRSVGTSTAAVTLNINALGAIQILASNGVTLSAGALVSGGFYQVVYDSATASFRLLSGIAVFTDPSTNGMTVAGATANGANIALVGNGGTTPNKFIRAANGVLQFLNSAYSAVIATISDTGFLTTPAGITATTGDITSNAGRLRANLGALGSGDNFAASILSDFPISRNANGWAQLPNGLIIQWGVGTTASGNGDGILFPVTFPTYVASIVANEGNAVGWNVGGTPGSVTIFGTTRSATNGFFLSEIRVTPTGALLSYQPGIAYNWIAIGW